MDGRSGGSSDDGTGDIELGGSGRRLTRLFQSERVTEGPIHGGTSGDDELEKDLKVDREMLHRAIADVGRWAYGTVAVEAWVYNEHRGVLVRPRRAFWFDPVAMNSGGHTPSQLEAIMRLCDYDREDFVAPDPLAPGVGLAGALWSELYLPRMRLSVTAPSVGGANVLNLSQRNIVWREVGPIAADPDQPYNLRLQVLAETGVTGLAAGVRFSFSGVQGMVIYMARRTCSLERLRSSSNEDYLLASADVIGSIAALRTSRHAILHERRSEHEGIRKRILHKMKDVATLEEVLKKQESEDGRTATCSSEQPLDLTSERTKSGLVSEKGKKLWHVLKKNAQTYFVKWKGANNKPPPKMSNEQSLLTFFGCYVTLLALINFSDAVSAANENLSLVLGPFGALMTLQYSLTQAPASQPRNTICGQAVAIAIAQGFTYTKLRPANQKALATALAICVMARLGITHPPAGAAALIFSGGNNSWGQYGIMIVGNALAVLFATVINNLSKQRIFPTYWGFRQWFDQIRMSCKGKKKES